MNRIKFNDIGDVIKALERIEKDDFELVGTWNVIQHLDHCAQTIQCSMTGYPQEKPRLMQATIGKLAFHIFNAKGYMSHNTNQLTTGIRSDHSENIQSAIKRLRENALQLLDWNQPLFPHEFYGRLSKKNHIRAHTLHFANHFESFKFK